MGELIQNVFYVCFFKFLKGVVTLLFFLVMKEMITEQLKAPE